MHHRVALAGTALALFLALACAVAPAQAGPNGLPPGHWIGRGDSYGHVYKQGKGHGVTSADSYGRYTMNLYVSQAGHVIGTLSCGGGANSYVHGGHGHFIYYCNDGFYASGNTAGGLSFNGTVHLRGQVNASGMVVPMEFEFPGNAVAHFTHLDCGSATGDLAVEARNAQQKAGFNTNVKAPFVLLRVGNAEAPGMSEPLNDVNHWIKAQGALEADLEINFAGRSKQQIKDEIKAAEDALDEMDKYRECGGKAPLPAYELAAMKELMADDIGLAELRLKNMP